MFLIAAVYIGGAIVFLLFWWLRKYLRRKQAMQREIEELRLALEKRSTDVLPKPALTIESEQESQPREAPEPELPVPVVPAGLVEACQKGECVVFVGPELSRAAGLPTWQEFVQGLFQWAMENKILDPSLEISYREALQSGQVDLVADGVASAVQAGENPARDLLLTYLQKIFGTPPAQAAPAHYLLKQIGFSGALTTNLDSLLEDALGAPVFTPLDAQMLLPKLAERAPFVLKLFGTLEKPDTIQISPTRYRYAVADNRVFLEFVEKLFLSRTVLFIGTSLDRVQSNLDAFQLRNMNRSHYALVGVSGREWEAKAVSMQPLGVQTLPYSVSKGDTAVLDFLRMLATKVTRSRATAKAAPLEPPYLKRVQLVNIGPFESLDLQLDPRWNVLLGDNGVGKSSILKAIALALCGKRAQKYADRLIKFGQPRGLITLEFTDGATNKTELYRTSSEPGIKAQELLGTEKWLAIGFPPMRQLDWTVPPGASSTDPQAGDPITTPKDLLPLVAGEPDPRMKDLKQSLINYHFWGQSTKGDKYKKLLNNFFDVVGEIAEGVTFQEVKDDKPGSQFLVKTADGPVPLAAVSQGTQSLLGWVGLLLQRLYEVYDNSDRPREEPALVLIDEIDAHMHPRWQQTIVKHVSALFPKVQFVATTHSPLIVGSLEPDQVYRFERDAKGMVDVARPEHALKGLGAAGLLTSGLFGLASQLDEETADALARKRRLTARLLDPSTSKKEREEIDAELKVLNKQVEHIDATKIVRDPLYPRFVEAMARVKQTSADEAQPITLTNEERKEQAKVAEAIVRDLVKSEDQI